MHLISPTCNKMLNGRTQNATKETIFYFIERTKSLNGFIFAFISWNGVHSSINLCRIRIMYTHNERVWAQKLDTVCDNIAQTLLPQNASISSIKIYKIECAFVIYCGEVNIASFTAVCFYAPSPELLTIPFSFIQSISTYPVAYLLLF